jgi:hypothetical protein
MSPVLIEHNAPWIGIPETFPYLDWATANEWADALVAELVVTFGEPEAGESAALREYLVTVAESREQRGADRGYIWADGWSTDSYLADVTMISAALSGQLTLDQLAGSEDPLAVEAPVIEPFVTASGLEGVVSARYLNAPGADGLIARADYVFPIPSGHLRLYTAQFDLVRFEKVLPKLADLATTIAIADAPVAADDSPIGT